MKDFSDFRCPWIYKQDIWRNAEAARIRYWPELTYPIDIEFLIQDRLGVDIDCTKGLFRTVQSNAFLTFDRKLIKIDNYAYFSGQFDGKINFDLAHEVGHFVQHEEIYNHLHSKINSIDDYFDFMNTAPKKEIYNFEYQASEFAGRFLVPIVGLSKAIEDCCQDIRSNGQFEKYRRDPDAFLSTISTDIADMFGVTYTNIEERVKRENIWPPVQLME